MSRTPAALALAVLSIGARSIGAEPCPPRAELGGDPAAVARVRTELDKLGVAIGSPGPGCRAIHAEVELDERGGIAVAVGDGARRSEGRVVSDAALAAAWIDSWLRDDDLGGHTTAIVAARVAARPAEAPPPAGPSVLDRGAFAVGYEGAFTGDDTSWSGGSAAACAIVGPVCVGARVRYGHQSSNATATNSFPDERTELAALATASTSLAIGRMAIVPELGLGFGRLSAERHGLCKTVQNPNCDPTTDPNCAAACDAAGNGTTGDTVTRSVDSLEPRAAAAVRLAIPLFDHVWLDALASVTYIPFAHALPFKPDPTSLPAGTDLNAFTLPGEPTSSIQLGVGLRVGVP